MLLPQEPLLNLLLQLLLLQSDFLMLLQCRLKLLQLLGYTWRDRLERDESSICFCAR